MAIVDRQLSSNASRYCSTVTLEKFPGGGPPLHFHINDDEAFALARNISRKVEEELQYPGQIRVTVVRETRCVEYAK